MAQLNHTRRLARTEEALIVLFCLIDDAYALLNPRARHYEALKRLTDSEVITLALFQQLRGMESERSSLRDTERFFAYLFPGVVGLHPSSFHRRVRKLRRFLEPLRQEVLSEMVEDPETLLVDSTLLSVLHPRQVSQGSGFDGAAWVRWGIQCLWGQAAPVVLHQPGGPLLRAHPCQRSGHLPDRGTACRGGFGGGVARRLLADLAYSSEQLRKALAEVGVLLATERSERRRGVRQQVEIALSSLKRVFGLGETLATTLIGLATRIAAKITAYTYAFLVNRLLGRPQGHIKELWA